MSASDFRAFIAAMSGVLYVAMIILIINRIVH